MSEKVVEQQVERTSNLVMERIPERTVATCNVLPHISEVAAVEEPAPKTMSEGLVRTQKILESIEQRIQNRARLVADRLRRTVEIEGELRQAEKDRDERLKAVERIHTEDLAEANKLREFRTNTLEGAFADLAEGRMGELSARGTEISKLDKSLEQLRKQLDTELGKMGAKVRNA